MENPSSLSSSSSSSLLLVAEQCIRLLKKKGIKLVVFDMDLTAVSKHSRGRLERGTQLDDFLSFATVSFKTYSNMDFI